MNVARRTPGGSVAARLSPRWVALLDSFGWGPMLAASNASGARVVSVETGRGEILAEVRGPDRTRSSVGIRVERIPTRVFDRALGAVAARASLAASLLAGHVASEVETAFLGAGRSLLPASARELTLTCSCGRESMPCPHAAALLLRVGSLLDEDPFLLFLLRGKERVEVLEALRHHRVLPGPGAARPREGALLTGAEPAEPLPAGVLEKPELFFRPLLPPATLRTTFAPPEHPEAVLTRLGPPPLADAEAARLLVDLHRAIGLGAAERLAEWEWRRAGGRGRSGPG